MTHPSAFELFAFWRSSATFRVRVALNLKGMSVPERIVNIDAGEQHSPEFLRINPLAGIPALSVPGQAPITQSLAILEYLEEVQPLPALLPSDPYGRARVRSLCNMLVADTHPLVTPRVKKYLTTRAAFDDAAWRAWQVQWFGAGIAAFEQRLACEPMTGAFCHEDRPTLADVCLASILAVMRVFAIAIPNTPHIDRVMSACDALEAFARASPRLQPGAPA